MVGKRLDKTSDEFGTPDVLWLPLLEEFNFTIDAAASKCNALLPRYYTAKDDALVQDFTNERVFCNPPYSRGNVKNFFMKAYEETRVSDRCKLWVLLIPTYTERSWYHEYRNHFEVRFIPFRVQFKGGASGARGNHMFVIFRCKSWCWSVC